MKTFYPFLRRAFLAFLIVTTALLCACTTVPKGPQLPGPGVIQALQPVEFYLQRAANSEAPEKQNYQLFAVQKLLQERRLDFAQTILNEINPQTLTPEQQQKYQLLTAQLYVFKKNLQQARDVLDQLPAVNTLTPENQVTYYLVWADFYDASNHFIASIQQRIQLNTVLSSSSAQQQNDLAIWQTAQKLSLNDLQLALQQPHGELMRGWLQLAYIAANTRLSSTDFIAALQNWRSQFPDHPANAILPKTFTQAGLISMPANIALLLPVTGTYAETGEAIRNGFFAAYYYAKQQGQPVGRIKVIDTANGNIPALYQQAVSDGASVVVGPLLKTNLEQLTKMHLSVPTLALNTLDHYQSMRKSDLYQFGLPLRDEAVSVATRAHQAGYTKALIIAPEGAWGQNQAQAIAATWRSLGGKVVGSLAFINQKNLASQIRGLLKVTESQQRARQLSQLVGTKVRATATRRQDVQVIFMIALPQMARQIKPLLKFYFAGNIPVYATSVIYSGRPAPQSDKDLNGTIFADMPWVIPGSTLSPQLKAIRTRVRSLWSSSYNRYPKMYALGIDAYTLVQSLNRMMIFPSMIIHGATGNLQLDQYHHIYRHLLWVQMRGGIPKRY